MKSWIASASILLLLASCSPKETGGDKQPGDTTSTATVDRDRSKVEADRTSGVRADGADAVTITITVYDTNGKPLEGATVALSASGDGVDLAQPAGPTGADGKTSGTLRSSLAGTVIVTAKATWQGREVLLFAQPAVTFVGRQPAKLAFTVPPGGGRPGAALSPALQVAIQDASGNTVFDSALRVTLALGENPTNAVLGGTTLSAVAVNGVATFGDVRIDRVGQGYMLVASAQGLTAATSPAFAISAEEGSRLAFIVQPAAVTAGSALTPAVAVALRDANGQPMAGASSQVTVALASDPAPGSAILSGTTTAFTSNGLATFPNLRIDKAGSYKLTVTATGFAGATSDVFQVSAAAATRLGFAAMPSTATAGSPLAPSLQIAVQDDFGNVLTSSTTPITLSIASGPTGAVLGGTRTVTPTLGVATFADLTLDKAGRYTFAATASGFQSATSGELTVTASQTNTRLAFTTQPPTAQAGVAFSPAVRVSVVDSFGNVVSDAAVPVTLELLTNPGGATLQGTASRTTTNGIAIFDAVSLDRVGQGYVLSASSPGFTSVSSNPFDVGFGPAAKLGFVVQPSRVQAGIAMSPAPRVAVQDQFGNVVTSAAVSITLALGLDPSSSSTLGGTLTATTVAGIATFPGLTLQNAASGFQFVATGGGLTEAVSELFEVIAGPAETITFQRQPAANVTAGSPITVWVGMTDRFGNQVSGTQQVVIAIQSNPSAGTLSGTQSVQMTGTSAIFNNLKIDKAGTGYTLVASAGTNARATSQPFNVVPSVAEHIGFVSQPSYAGVGIPLTPVTVAIQDVFGNTVTSYSPTQIRLEISVNPGAATLGGTTLRSTVNGVATFSDLTFDKMGVGYKLRAVSSAFPLAAVSAPIEVTAGFAQRLAFTLQPKDTVAGSLFDVRVSVVDQGGNIVPAATPTIGLAATDVSPSQLPGAPVSVTAVAGTALFAGVRLTTAGAGYQLAASADGLLPATSQVFRVATAAPSETVSTATAIVPDALLANGSQSASIEVVVRDGFGNPIPGALVSLTADPADGCVVTQPVATNASGATTGAILSTIAGTKTLTATITQVPGMTLEAPIVLAAQPTVKFNAGLPDALKSDVAASVTQLVANGSEFTTITATVVDSQNNRLPDADVSFTVTGSATFYEVMSATDANGIAEAKLHSTKAEVVTVTVTALGNHPLNRQPVVTFVPGPVDAVRSSASVAPASLVADGVAAATVTAIVRDAFDNPIPNATVALALTGEACTAPGVTPAGRCTLSVPAKTGANGQTTATLKSTKAETKEITATATAPGATAVVLDARPSVTFDPGAPTAADTTIEVPATAIIADNAQTAAVTVTVRDRFRNPYPGASVVVTTTGTANTWSVAGATANDSGELTTLPGGIAALQLSSTKAEVKTISAKITTSYGTITATAKPTVTFVPGPVSTAKSPLTVSPDALLANDTAIATITAVVRDAFDNPIPNATVALSLTGASCTAPGVTPAGRCTLSLPAATGANGQTTATLKSTLAESKTITATAVAGTAAPVALEGAPIVTFNPGAPTVADTTVETVLPTPLIADNVQTATVKVTVRDRFLNVFPGATVVVTTTGTGNTWSGATAVANDSPAGTSDAGGLASWQLRTTKAEVKTISAKVTTSFGVITATAKPTITFDHGEPSLETSTLTFAPAGPIIANDTALCTVTATVKDVFGNPVDQANVVFTTSGTGNTWAPAGVGNDSGALASSLTGIATATLKSTKAETKALTAAVTTAATTLTLGANTAVQVVFDHGPVDLAVSQVLAAPATDVIAGTNPAAGSEITVTVLDKFSNPIDAAKVTVTAAPTTGNSWLPAGATTTTSGERVTGLDGVARFQMASTKAPETKTVTANITGGGALVTKPTVGFVPDVPDATKSTIAVSKTGAIADDTDFITVTVTVRDQFGNPIKDREVGLDPLDARDTFSPATTLITAADGSAAWQLRSTLASEKTLSAYVVTGASTLPLSAQPKVTFDHGAPNGATTVIVATPSVPAATSVVADNVDTALLSISVRDAFNNPIDGASTTVTVTGTANTFAAPALTAVDGTTQTSLRSTKAESKTISASVRVGTGTPVALAASTSMLFVAGPPSATTSTVVAAPTTSLIANGIDAFTITTTVRDAFNNLVPDVTVALASSNGTDTVSAPTTTDATGIATGTLSATKAEAKTITATATRGTTSVVLAQKPVVTFIFGAPVAATTTLVATPTTGLLANGADTTTLTLTVLDAQGNPVQGQQVTLMTTGSKNRFAPARTGVTNATGGPTNAAGQFVATLTTTMAETKRFIATIESAEAFNEYAEATFDYEPPEATAVNVVDSGGCIRIDYDVFQPQTQKVDILVEYDATGTGSFLPATQGSGDVFGVSGVTTGAQSPGLRHTFLWNSTADLPRQKTTTGRVRVTPLLRGVAGRPFIAEGVQISNVLAFDDFTSYPAGTTSKGIVVADFNRDGKVDIATTSVADATLSERVVVLSGNGSGGFAGAQNFPMYRGATPPTLGTRVLTGVDFNVDGYLDLVTAEVLAGTLTILPFNKTKGNFSPADPVPATAQYPGSTYSIGVNASSLTAADLDRDGQPEILVGYGDRQTLTLIERSRAGVVSVANDAITIGAVPSAVIVADFNRDALPDLATANQAEDSIRLLLGLSPGVFAAPLIVPLAAGAQPSALTAADLNADGRLDLAVANFGNMTASVLLGDGTGGFAPAVSYYSGEEPSAILASDLDDDSLLDLAITNQRENTVGVLIGKRDGTFEAVTHHIANGQPLALATGDFNGDGRNDLAAAAWDLSAVDVLLNARPRWCDPGFTAATNSGLGEVPQALAEADFNTDGKPDVAIIDGSPNDQDDIRILYGTGNGSYRLGLTKQNPGGAGGSLVAADFSADGVVDLVAPATTGINFFASATANGVLVTGGADTFLPRALAAADFNGDDKNDVAAVSASGVNVYLSKGSGFDPPKTTELGGALHLAAADVDQDAKVDLVVVDSANVLYLRGAGDGTFEPARPFAAGTQPRFVVTGKFNGDDIVDLAVSNAGSSDVTVLLGNPAVLLDPTVEVFLAQPAHTLATAPRWLRADDFDGDQRLDLAVGFESGEILKVLFGGGDGTFVAETDWVVGAAPIALAAADYDGDRKLDLSAVVRSGSPRLTTLHGNGASRSFLVLKATPSYTSPASATAADIDGDAKLDLALSSALTNEVSVYLGNGDATFVRKEPATSVLQRPGAAVNADFDRDGIPDLALAAGTDGMLVLLGNRDGTYHGQTAYVIPTIGGYVPAPSAIATGDLDVDGDLDLVVASGGHDKACTFLNDGAGQFTLMQPTTCNVIGLKPRALLIEDFDRDGTPDVAAANEDVDSVGVLIGRRDGTYEPLRSFAVGSKPRSLATGDLNRDGVLDLVTANGAGKTVSVLAGTSGSFSTALAYPTAGAPSSLAISDVDDNGTLDVLGFIEGNGLAVYPGSATGALGSPVSYLARYDLHVLSDFNRDGKLDAFFAVGASMGVCLGR